MKIITEFPFDHSINEEDEHEIWWRIGWHPYRYFLLIVVSFLIFSSIISLIPGLELLGPIFTLVGIGVGLAVYYLGSREVNKVGPTFIS
ncbi:MAG: hypothetical protein ABEI86_05505, partial [Halobacteriaceae archaeon]